MERMLELRKLKEAIDRVFDEVFDHLQVEELCLVEDYYFELSQDDRYNIVNNPLCYQLGSLFDDLDFVLAALEDGDSIPPIILIHIAPLLQYLGEYDGWYKKL